MLKISRSAILCLILSKVSFVSAQDYDNPEDEFDAIFTPLQQVEGSQCARYHNWNSETVTPLFNDQLLLFRNAYAAVTLADDEWLKTLVTDGDAYLDMYGFISNVRQLAQNDMGVKYMYQETFDASIEQHRLLGSSLSSAPDAIVGIFWCQPIGTDTAPRFTGGYAYLKVVDGDWKFHTR